MLHSNIAFDRYASIGTVMHYILVISYRVRVRVRGNKVRLNTFRSNINSRSVLDPKYVMYFSQCRSHGEYWGLEPPIVANVTSYWVTFIRIRQSS